VDVPQIECRSSLENNQNCSAALQADSKPVGLQLSPPKVSSTDFASSDVPSNAPKVASSSDASRTDSSSNVPKTDSDDSPKLGSDASSDAEKFPHNVWVNFGGVSYHFDRDRGFNEKNFGIGLEYEFNKDWSLAVGQYRNSIDRTSHYAAVTYTPFHAGNFSFGAAAGTVDGYYFRNGGFIPMAMPMATYETKHFGLNALYVPKMKDISSVVGLQFKVKF
jgi:hypothetical protein